MADFIFRLSPNVVLGSYVVTRVPQYVKEYGSRFMVVMDPVLKDVGLADKILQPLNERNVDYFIFDELNDGANSKQIQQALELAKQGYVQGIIAVGGTKALNIASAVAALFNESFGIYDCLDGTVPTKEALPLICVPTTIRIPFLFNPVIPLIDARCNQIKLMKVQKEICKLAVMDSTLIASLTENQKSSISLETLCIAVEAYLSQKASFFSDMFCEKSAELFGYALDGSKSLEIATPEEVLLEQAGCMASLAASTSSVGVASLISLAMNARFRLSRSLVSAILFPYIIEDASKFKTEKLEKFAKMMNIVPSDATREDAVQAFADNIRQRLVQANLPVRLKDLSLSVEQLALIAEDASNLDIMNQLPRSMTADDLFDLLKLAY